MLVNAVVGEESFGPPTNESIKVFAHYSKTLVDRRVALNTAISIPTSTRCTPIHVERMYASELNRNYGEWEFYRLDVPDGCFIFIEVQHKRTYEDIFYKKYFSVLGVRQTAASRLLRIPLTEDSRAAFDHIEYRGRFDILSIEEFNDLVPIVDFMLADSNMNSLLDYAEVAILEEEKQRRVKEEVETVQTISGKTLILPKPKLKRRLKF